MLVVLLVVDAGVAVAAGPDDAGADAVVGFADGAPDDGPDDDMPGTRLTIEQPAPASNTVATAIFET